MKTIKKGLFITFMLLLCSAGGTMLELSCKENRSSVEIFSFVTSALILITLPFAWFLKDTIIEYIASQRKETFITPGLRAITNERKEQIYKHGYTLVNDKKYINGELQQLAKYALTQDYVQHWPERIDNNLAKKIHAKNRKEQLILAGAFIAAELDRLHHE